MRPGSRGLSRSPAPAADRAFSGLGWRWWPQALERGQPPLPALAFHMAGRNAGGCGRGGYAHHCPESLCLPAGLCKPRAQRGSGEGRRGHPCPRPSRAGLCSGSSHCPAVANQRHRGTIKPLQREAFV